MDTTGLPLSDRDWQELQRECHPFPAYIDYIHGQPTEYEREQEQRMCDGAFPQGNYPWGTLAVPDTGPTVPAPAPRQLASRQRYPTPQSSSQQFPRDFHAKATTKSSPETPCPAPRTLQRASQGPHPPQVQQAQQAQQAPQGPPVHILRGDDILDPQYEWMPLDTRCRVNVEIIKFHRIINNPHEPPERRQMATQALRSLSQRIGTEQTKRLRENTIKTNVHTVLPGIWAAMKARQELPSEDPRHKIAAQYLVDVNRLSDEHTKLYTNKALSAMLKAQSQGQDPLALIPGYKPPRHSAD